MSRRRRSRSSASASRSKTCARPASGWLSPHDADRRRIERDLHDGPQQHLVALAVNLQLARDLVDADPLAAKALLEDMGREVQLALEETAKLAHRIYPPLLEAGGLACGTARGGAERRQSRRSSRSRRRRAIRPRSRGRCTSAVSRCSSAPARVRERRSTSRVEGDAVLFEVAEHSGSWRRDDALGDMRDRVAALGGRLTLESEPGRGTHVSGSLPLSR